ncbi:MAG: 3-deoxy-D-manno-octulosonate 8-phosphate phosphatase [Tannerellaceae bacterium]|jgi:3-deoxy-D-manno-octulosonate 8-phosphate phosphatase (KDO 8-P phosphatase)|nr:3-deoxy-D-manno-octulosonate 8-phosphate phosphatase [Tannerellaceae bacterium]
MINYDLTRIKAFLFDVDGVLSYVTMPLGTNGEPTRSVNVRDGYAMQLAVKKGLIVGIISGAVSESLRVRFSHLGIKEEHLYMGSRYKNIEYNDFKLKTGLADEEILYAGDDIPDQKVMAIVGLPVAPADAAPEIKAIAKYISFQSGGEGVARDVIEQTMKAQNLWMDDAAFGW